MNSTSPVEISNIVASGKLNLELDLAPVARDLRTLDQWIEEVEHSRRSGNRLLIYFTQNDALGILTPTGVYVFTGVNTVEKIEDARKALLTALSELGIISNPEPISDEVVESFAFHNFVCTSEVDFELDLNATAIGLGMEKVEYEPEQFPGLVYRLDNPPCTILLFSSGKLVITGVASEEEANKAYGQISVKLAEIFKQK